MKKLVRGIFLLLAGFTLTVACVESVAIEEEISSSLVVEEIVVVEATITNELKQQQIVLRRASSFLNDSITFFEVGASVQILDDVDNIYAFSEIESGTYQSVDAFQALPDRAYQLQIVTSENESINSDFESYSETATLDRVFAERGVNEMGDEGVFVYIDNTPAGTSNFYRYEYEETYKIIAPFWSEFEYRLSDYDPCGSSLNPPQPIYNLELAQRQEEAQVCFQSNESNRIILAENGSGTGISGFPVRFIAKDDFIITNRYSILVRQFLEDEGTYSFYRQLNDFSSNENVFTQVQPGALEGNLSFVQDSDNKMVIGYFSVSPVSERRLFFDFEEIFPGEDKPIYVDPCALQSSPESHISYCCTGMSCSSGCPLSVIERINFDDDIAYFAENDGSVGSCPGPDIYVKKVCGDCRELGSNIVPDFWEE